MGQAGDGVSAVNIALELKPDVIIMDVMMPLEEWYRRVQGDNGDAPGHEGADSDGFSRGGCRDGGGGRRSATGFLQKYSGKEKLLDTVREVSDGEYRIPSNVLRSVFAGIRGSAEQKTTDGPKSLTQRDREILTLFAQGLSYAEIAEARNNQPLTIRNAIYSIQDKLGIDTKQELVVWAVRNGLLDNYQIGR